MTAMPTICVYPRRVKKRRACDAEQTVEPFEPFQGVNRIIQTAGGDCKNARHAGTFSQDYGFGVELGSGCEVFRMFLHISLRAKVEKPEQLPVITF